jgi:kumamolisin
LNAEAVSGNGSTLSSVRLSGHIPNNSALANAKYLGRLEADKTICATFTFPLRNQEELEALIQAIHDPSNKNYGKYLTTDEFIERFAPAQEDYDMLIAYAQELGLTVNSTHSNRILLTMSGSTQAIESALNLNLHQYQLSSGRKFHVPNNDPELPVHIAAVITGVVGLDSHAVRRPYSRKKNAHAQQASSETRRAFPSGPNGGFSPSDLVTAYKLGSISEKGSGQIIALFELADYQDSDINDYANYFGLPAPKLKRVLVDGGSGKNVFDPEVALDIELALALAPQSQIYVYEGPNSEQGVLDTYNQIAKDNIAKQVSTSWGMGEDMSSIQSLQAENAIFQQMAAQGQSIYAAAGDSGAYDDYSSDYSKALVVDDPASQPYVVSVGGTSLTVNPTSGLYINESVWNDSLGNGAGGGGVSRVWSIPSWQANVLTTYSKTHRNVPDVSLNADPNTGYAIYYEGQWMIYGGTSCAAPLWAAFTALVNQQLASISKPALGFANPIFYTLCGGTSYVTNFHDITLGNNLYYAAHTGYDNASGWGSFNGANLFASLTSILLPGTLPILNISMTHVGNFIKKNGMGAYQINVANKGTGATSGPVSVAVSLPNGLTYLSSSGSGWVFNKNNLTFTQNNVLHPGGSYPPITLNVKVNFNTPSLVVPKATVSGGGSVSNSALNPTVVI